MLDRGRIAVVIDVGQRSHHPDRVHRVGPRVPRTGVTATFIDGAAGEFDLVVGADGVRSMVRGLAFGQGCVNPEFTQQIVWRVMLPRHAEVGENMMLFYGPADKIGFSPMSPDEMYMFLVQNVPARVRPLASELGVMLRNELAAYSGWLTDISAQIDARSRIDYARSTPSWSPTCGTPGGSC